MLTAWAGLRNVMATSSSNTVNLDPPSCLLPLVRALHQLPEALHSFSRDPRAATLDSPRVGQVSIRLGTAFDLDSLIGCILLDPEPLNL